MCYMQTKRLDVEPARLRSTFVVPLTFVVTPSKQNMMGAEAFVKVNLGQTMRLCRTSTTRGHAVS